jgi:hypothetical protein
LLESCDRSRCCGAFDQSSDPPKQFPVVRTRARRERGIGVILLLFGVGLHFSVGDLNAVKALGRPLKVTRTAFPYRSGVSSIRYMSPRAVKSTSSEIRGPIGNATFPG